MTYSQQEINQIVTLRNNNVKWKIISQTVNKSETALRKWWEKYQKLKDLPPKPKIDNTLTTGRIGLQIKKLIKDNPKISVRDIEGELKKLFGQATKIPSYRTIHRYLQKNQIVVIKLLKKTIN